MLYRRSPSLILMLSVVLSACDSGSSGFGSGSGGGGSSSTNTDNGPKAWLVGDGGAAISLVKVDDPVIISARELTPNTPYHVTITDPSGVKHNPGDGYYAVTDEEGRLTNITVVQDLSLVAPNDAVPALRLRTSTRDAFPGTGSPSEPLFIDPAEPAQAVTGSPYVIEIRDSNDTVQRTMEFEVTTANRLYCADASGVAKASFAPAENVYARVMNLNAADGTYKAHVISDLNIALTEGSFLSGEAELNVQITGGEGLVDMGAYPLGQYDVVVDVDGNGAYNLNTDLISRSRRLQPCFTVQNTNTAQPIQAQIAADRSGNHREIFDPATSEPYVRDVSGFITPQEQSLIAKTMGVRNYITLHKNSWMDGDALVEASTYTEITPVQTSSMDQSSWPLWSREQLAPGCYDVVVDVDADGVFDSGVDFVDNVDRQGVASCGFRVADPACASNITISSPSVGQLLDVTAVSLAGTVAGNPVSGSVTIVSGSQSNTVNLTPGANGAFSATLPLFSGRNVLTVAFIYADGNTCARTFPVITNSPALSNSLVRVQLTWDGDTDMDLHYVRPNGLYFEDADDCHFANCKVGTSGTGSNSIDWGNPGEDDDPKLDVDCISCGNGIENIWMNEITNDGEYTVLIDAFSGTETDVTASVYIRNAQVGRVVCGDMSSSSTTDTCRVGTIRWNGGSTGTGTFTPDGTKGSQSDF